MKWGNVFGSPHLDDTFGIHICSHLKLVAIDNADESVAWEENLDIASHSKSYSRF